MYAYSPEELAGIEAQHNEGRLMPFIELPLIGGQYLVRFIREGDRYVANLTARDATMFLSGINSACALHDVAAKNESMACTHCGGKLCVGDGSQDDPIRSCPSCEPTYRAGMLAGIQKTLDEWGKSEPPLNSKPMAHIHRNEYNEYRLEPADDFNIKDIPVGVDVQLYPKGGA